MNPLPATVIELTGWQACALLIGLAAPMAFGLIVLLHFFKDRRRTAEGTPDWSIPAVDAQAHGGSPLHRWAVPVKIGSLLAFSFLVVILDSLFWSMVALGCSLVAVHLSRVPWRAPLRRLAAMSGFLGMLLLVLPLTGTVRPGETVLIVGPFTALPFRLEGLRLALTLACKAITVALLMEPMVATAPLSRTIRGFAALGLPPALTEMLLLCHRYLFVFQEEMSRMHRSLRVRGFRPATNVATLRTVGNSLGMLFVRSFERTERVHEAMLCRGYRGVLPAGKEPVTSGDWLKGAVVVLLGLALLFLDRSVPVSWF